MTVRILQVVGGMNRGGTETWLMHVLRHVDPARCRMDFLVHGPGPWAYEPEIRALGGRMLVCPWPQRPWRYAREFRRLLREHGPYGVVHSHLQHYSGWILRLAHQADIPVRIAHSHLDSVLGGGGDGLLRRAYVRLMRHWIARHATLGLAVSLAAAAALFGPGWQADTRRRLFYCGIDLAPFRVAVDGAEKRAELGIPRNAFVVGHVGRFMEQKNHAFVVDVAAAVARREARLHLLLLGDGPLRPAIEEQVRRAGLWERAHFAGLRPDVPQLMSSVMDVGLLPSLYEGLPLVGMEAQAAGLPLVLSDTITPEMDVVPGLLRRCSLAQPAAEWADAVLALRDGGRSADPDEAWAAMENSPFNIHRGVHLLEQLYAGAAGAN